jgi:HSP20 family protein
MTPAVRGRGSAPGHVECTPTGHGSIQMIHKERKVMANIIRRPLQEWEPMRFMRDMMNWEPFRSWAPFGSLRQMESLGEWMPDFEVKENGDRYIIRGDVPGLTEKELEVSLSGNVLTIGGKREEEKKEEGERFYTYERSYGSFSRSFVLPEGVDSEHIATELKDGVLTLALPKTKKVATRKIEVKRGKGNS